jgi:ribosomal protein S18 acetylase RimI-like enzyme
MIGHGLREGATRPEWLWRAYDGDELVAAVAWWSNDEGRPEMVDLLGSIDAATGAELLTRSRDALDVTSGLSCVQVDEDVATLGEALPVVANALTFSGFVPEVDRVRVEWKPTSPVPAQPGRLAMQPARAQREADVVELFAAVSDGSLDHGMIGDRTDRGRTGEAEHRLQAALRYAGEPDWFTVAVGPGGGLVGYVVPALVDGNRPVIAEIGVAAAYRGHGYSDDLLAHGTRVLADAGAPQVRGDTDLANTPMRAAFRRAGYVEFARRFDYSWRPG